MKRQKDILDKIANFWENYILEYKFCQSQINFNEEIKTNYFGDILAHFLDTLDLIKNKSHKGSYQANVFYSIGLLQTIYIQQDFINELLFIFKFDKDKLSNDDNRNINRQIRNELIGHPIRRAKEVHNKLISSVIFGNNLDHKTIHYIIYRESDDFSPQEVTHNVIDIIKRHEAFLLKNFELIEKKIFNILEKFLKEIDEVDLLIKKQIPFDGLLRVIRQKFESIYKENHLFVEEYLIEINNRKAIHKRYEFAINLFFSQLKEKMQDTSQDINTIIGKKSKTSQVTIQENPRANNTKYNYELGKLHSKHPVFDTEYFKSTFSSNEDICLELDNMRENRNSDLEYYCSYEYMEYLIKLKI